MVESRSDTQTPGSRAGEESMPHIYYNVILSVLTSTDPGTNVPLPVTVAAKHYDWTYTVTYPGHHSDPAAKAEFPPHSIPWTDADSDNPLHSIPLAELTRPDPILFYAEIPLFEDELHDNGSSNLLVRIVCLPNPMIFLSF
jgi:type 2A phosphatase activator TIP41